MKGGVPPVTLGVKLIFPPARRWGGFQENPTDNAKGSTVTEGAEATATPVWMYRPIEREIARVRINRSL